MGSGATGLSATPGTGGLDAGLTAGGSSGGMSAGTLGGNTMDYNFNPDYSLGGGSSYAPMTAPAEFTPNYSLETMGNTGVGLNAGEGAGLNMQGSDLTPSFNPGYQSWQDKLTNAGIDFGKRQIINSTPVGRAYNTLTGFGAPNNTPLWATGARTLAGLYSANEAMKSAQANQEAIQQQQRQLADMYGPNSPYAAQLRQALARKDARAGRNSQYGPREVELQAQLARASAGAAPAMAQLSTAGNNANTAVTNARNAGLNTVLGGLSDAYGNW